MAKAETLVELAGVDLNEMMRDLIDMSLDQLEKGNDDETDYPS